MSIFIGNKNNKKIFSINKLDQHDVPDENTVFHSQLPYLEVEVYDIPPDNTLLDNPLAQGAFSKVRVYDLTRASLALANRAFLLSLDGRILQPYYSVHAGYRISSLYPEDDYFYEGAFNPFGTMDLGNGEKYGAGRKPTSYNVTQGANNSPDYVNGKLYVPVITNGDGLRTEVTSPLVQLIVFKNINFDQAQGYTYQALNETQDKEIYIDNTTFKINNENIIDKKFLTVFPNKARVTKDNKGENLLPAGDINKAIVTSMLGTHYYTGISSIKDKRWSTNFSKSTSEPTLIDLYAGYAVGHNKWFSLDNNNLVMKDIFLRGNNNQWPRIARTEDNIGAPIFHVLQGRHQGNLGVSLDSSRNALTVGNNVPLFDPSEEILRKVQDPVRVQIPAIDASFDFNVPRVPNSSIREIDEAGNIVTVKTIKVKKDKTSNEMPIMYSISSPYASVSALEDENGKSMDFSRIFSAGTNGVHSGLLNLPVGGKAIFYSTSNGGTSHRKILRYTALDGKSRSRYVNDFVCGYGGIYIEREHLDEDFDNIHIRYQSFMYFQRNFNDARDTWTLTAHLFMPGFVLDILPLV